MNSIKIEFEGKTGGINQYIDLLKIRDSNALILKVGYSSYWSKGFKSNVIVYLTNGTVEKFEIFEPSSPTEKIKIKRGKIKKREYEYYWDFLTKSSKENRFKIDKSKLNITKKPDPENEEYFLSKSISDGVSYYFEIYQKDHFIAYQSYEPQSYIKDKYPGFEERQKLVDIMNNIERLFKMY